MLFWVCTCTTDRLKCLPDHGGNWTHQGWIQHDLVGGGGALPALVPSCVGHVCRPPINLLHYCKVLLDYSIWIVIVVHIWLIIMLLLKLLYLILSLISFCFFMKNSTPLHPLWPGLGGCTPYPRPSKSIPGTHNLWDTSTIPYQLSCQVKLVRVCGIFPHPWSGKLFSPPSVHTHSE
jgi:hypothetical protein